jgi:hypothetical protein
VRLMERLCLGREINSKEGHVTPFGGLGKSPAEYIACKTIPRGSMHWSEEPDWLCDFGKLLNPSVSQFPHL